MGAFIILSFFFTIIWTFELYIYISRIKHLIFLFYFISKQKFFILYFLLYFSSKFIVYFFDLFSKIAVTLPHYNARVFVCRRYGLIHHVYFVYLCKKSAPHLLNFWQSVFRWDLKCRERYLGYIYFYIAVLIYNERSNFECTSVFPNHRF